MSKNSVRDRLHSRLIEYMKEINKWEESLVNELPSSWENYSGFIIFSSPTFLNPKWRVPGSEIWKIVCDCLKGHSIGIKGRIKNDSFRSPKAELVYGDSPIVQYLDNHVKYSWNVEKNMFCAGNVTERHRIGSFHCLDEVIVDLFAGIGYFTLPYLVHAQAKFVHACEWNPYAVEALRRNLKLNKVEAKCKIYEGDNRKVCPKRVANRVNLGLIPSSEEFWSVACEALVETGGILYIHNNVTSQISSESSCEVCKQLLTRLNLSVTKNTILPQVCFQNARDRGFNHHFSETLVKWKYPEWFVFSIHVSHRLLTIFDDIYESPWSVNIENVFEVKSYAPHIDHLVFTVVCKPL